MSAVDYSIKDIEKVIKRIDGTITKIDISRLTAPGENFLTLVFRVDFQVEKNGQTDIVSTVVKRLPLIDSSRLPFNDITMRNEINWYTKLLPQIKEFAKEYGINTDFYPDYLGSRFSLDPTKQDADSESMLILENLHPKGYKNEDRHVGFDLVTTKALIKILAAFHSVPLIMKFKKPKEFNEIKNFVQRNYAKRPPPPTDRDKKPVSPTQRIFEKMFQISACQPYKTKLEAIRDQPFGPGLWFEAGPEPWNTIIHSDFWLNNIMLKKEKNQEILVKLVDFQTYAYCSTAKDVVFLLLTSVQNDVLQENLDRLLKYYYEELSSILENANVPEMKFSYEDYLEEIKRVVLDSEFARAVFFSSISFAPKGAAPDFLTGEGDMFDHIENVSKNMTEKQKAKLALITELCGTRGWI